MSNDLRIDIALQHQGCDFKAYTIIKEPDLTADNVDHIMAEIGCSVRRTCINHGIVPDPLLDLDSNLAHDEQSEASTSSDFEKSNVTGVVA
jgi:hypothetical protein